MLNFNGTNLFIFAHPDDESFYAGGIIHYSSLKGVATVVSLTMGEKAKSDHSPEKLKKIREQEFYQACNILGANNQYCFDFGDGKLTENQENTLLKITEIIENTKPERIFTFADEDNYFHKDHIITQKLVLEAGKIFNKEVFLVGPESENNYFLRNQRNKTAGHYLDKKEYSPQNLAEIFYLNDEIFKIKIEALLSHNSQNPDSLVKHLETIPKIEKVYKPILSEGGCL